MTSNLTQKEMISNLATNTKGDFYWRLKYLMPRASRNPEDETAYTAKHKRVSPIGAIAKREHEHEIFNFLAVIYHKYSSHFQWVRVFMRFTELVKIVSISKPVIYNYLGIKKLNT